MKIINRLLLLALASLSLSSCSVYYTTSQVDQSLKSSLNQANNSLNQLENQMLNLQSQYNGIQCDTKPEAMKQSDVMFATLQFEMDKVNQLKAQLNQEYANFQKYTQGKDKIVSGTPEFTQLKETRGNIKTKMGDLQAKGEATVKQAQSFSDYVSKNVIPNIRMVDVAAYKSKFEQSIAELSNSEQTFYQELKKYDDQMNQVIAKFQTTHASQCASLKSDFQALNDHQKSIVAVKVDLLSTLKKFQEQTRGMKTISSCSNQWPLVAAADQSIALSQTRLNGIQNDIQKTVCRIEATIKSLK